MHPRYVVLDKNGRIYDEAPTIGGALHLAAVLDRVGIYGPYRVVELTEPPCSDVKVAA